MSDTSHPNAQTRSLMLISLPFVMNLNWKYSDIVQTIVPTLDTLAFSST
jgi:hypothetical protein